MAADTDFFEHLTGHQEIKTASDRAFGVVIGVVMAGIGGWRYWQGSGGSLGWFIASGLVLAVALAYPRVLSPLNRL